MKGFSVAKGMLLAGALAAFVGLACDPLNNMDRDTGTMVLLFANDTVFVTVPDGEISSGPIVIDATTTFGAEFVDANGQIDERIMFPRYILEVASGDTNLVKFVRGTAFSGDLVKVAAGETAIAFSLYDVDLDAYGFQVNVPITIN